MPSVKEYVRRKERAMMEIQRGVHRKTEEIDRGTRQIQKNMDQFAIDFERDTRKKSEELVTATREMQRRMDEFTKKWYG
ncbi:MAG: hypothetical protein NWE85_01195 [Candidatus Bathyarchaeota archaeon]|nr:hypothetical protein [Candidatus Bathyarchaeota archaeon]